MSENALPLLPSVPQVDPIDNFMSTDGKRCSWVTTLFGLSSIMLLTLLCVLDSVPTKIGYLAHQRPSTARFTAWRPVQLDQASGPSFIYPSKHRTSTIVSKSDPQAAQLLAAKVGVSTAFIQMTSSSTAFGAQVDSAAPTQTGVWISLAVIVVLSMGAASVVLRAIRNTGFVTMDKVVDSADEATRLQIAANIFANDQRPVILFDGVCNLCNTGVNFVLDWDPEARFRLAALQSVEGRALLQRSGRSPDDISSIVLVTTDGCHIKSDAVLRIGQGLSAGPWPLLATPAFVIPKALRDAIYDQVATNRYNFFGRTPACRLSTDGFRERFVTMELNTPA